MNVVPGLAAMAGAANTNMNYAWISTGICGVKFGMDIGMNFGMDSAWILHGFSAMAFPRGESEIPQIAEKALRGK